MAKRKFFEAFRTNYQIKILKSDVFNKIINSSQRRRSNNQVQDCLPNELKQELHSLLNIEYEKEELIPSLMDIVLKEVSPINCDQYF